MYAVEYSLYCDNLQTVHSDVCFRWKFLWNVYMTSNSQTMKTLHNPAYQFISHGLVHPLLLYLQIMQMLLW